MENIFLVNFLLLDFIHFLFFQVFFRTGTINRLEEQRDLVLTDTVIRLQAVCRGVIARRRMQIRKVSLIVIITHFHESGLYLLHQLSTKRNYIFTYANVSGVSMVFF